jgi:hypothetical protein
MKLVRRAMHGFADLFKLAGLRHGISVQKRLAPRHTEPGPFGYLRKRNTGEPPPIVANGFGTLGIEARLRCGIAESGLRNACAERTTSKIIRH